jgi:hypothetical protein
MPCAFRCCLPDVDGQIANAHEETCRLLRVVWVQTFNTSSSTCYRPEDGSKEKEIFRWLDVFFTSMFVLEILVRFVAHVGLEFIKDGWNVCDLIIVSFSVVQIIITDIIEVNQLRLLRFFRVLRVLRIFGKLQQLRHIVSSITKAVIPVRDAIFIVLMVAFMYAIIGVDIYGSTSPGNLFLLPLACIRANGIVLSYLDLDFMS